MGARGRAALTRQGGRSAPWFYTAQDVARFCEVDLKTIHHWADAGKIRHHRTEGRHLRFRRNDLLAFLRAHGYPLHSAITTARPTVFFSLGDEGDEVARRLGTKLDVVRFDSAIAAIAHVASVEPDAIVVTADDATIAGASSLAALKAAAPWTLLVAIDGAAEVDLPIPRAEMTRLPAELVRRLAVE